MAHWRLKIAAAQYALGLANTDDLTNAADRALNDSVYSHSLGELYSFRNPSWADCAPLFVAALRELQIEIPDCATAVMTLLEYHLIRLVEGAALPRETLNDLDSIYNLSWNYFQRKVPPEALKPLSAFMGYYSATEEWHGYQAYRQEQSLPPADEAELVGLHAEFMSLAVEWLRERWGPVISRTWLTSTVHALAIGIYQERAFDRLPILADALQDAGCDNEDILNHFRQQKEHVRGCFVVDLLLGKS